MLKLVAFFILITLTGCSLILSFKLNNVRQGEYINQNSFKTEIPFKIINGNIIVTVKIEEKEYGFLFDTGSPLVIDTEIAKKIKLEKIGKHKVYDAYGKKEKLVYAKIGKLSIETLDFFEMGSIITNLDFMVNESCTPISGIFGANLMSKAIWQINYNERMLIATDKIESLAIPKESVSINFRASIGGTPKFNVNINNSTYEAIIDTGFDGGIALPVRNSQELNNINEFLVGYGFASSIFGSTLDTVRLTKKSIAINENFKVTDEIITFKNGITSGIFGNDFLNNYILTIDWRNGNIIFSPLNHFAVNSFESFGFKVKFRDKKLIVSFLYEGSPAEKSGLEIGDSILRINEWDFSNINQNMYCNFMQSGLLNGTEQLSISLIKDGSEKILLLSKIELLK